MKFLTDKAHKFEEKFTSKAGKLLAFWGALGGLIAMGSSMLCPPIGVMLPPTKATSAEE